MGRKPNAVLWPEWRNAWDALLPNERAEAIRQMEFGNRAGRVAAIQVRTVASLYERLPEFEKAEADAAVRRTK